MAAKIAAVTGVVTVLTITPAVFRLYSQFWCLNICFQMQIIHWRHYFSDTSNISREINNIFVNNPKVICKGHLSSVMMSWIIQNILNNMHIMKCKSNFYKQFDNWHIFTSIKHIIVLCLYLITLPKNTITLALTTTGAVCDTWQICRSLLYSSFRDVNDTSI